jgi:hypothetical protein
MKKKNMIIVAHKFHSVCITLSFRFDLPPPVYANRFTSNPLQNRGGATYKPRGAYTHPHF